MEANNDNVESGAGGKVPGGGRVCDTCGHWQKDPDDSLGKLERRFTGKRVLIVQPGHIHESKTGTVMRLEHAHALGKYGFVVNYDDGLSGFIFNGAEWRVLD
jgi:hypothetical protein